VDQAKPFFEEQELSDDGKKLLEIKQCRKFQLVNYFGKVRMQ